MFGVKSAISLFQHRVAWRRKNRANTTHAINAFDAALVSVGDWSYGGIKLYSTGDSGKLVIGRFCSIGPEVVFVMNNEHQIDGLSTFPFKRKMLGRVQSEALSKGGIVIEDDVWIGCRATILDGVNIGQGAVVAACAVVTKDVPPYAVVAGCPARVIRMRFDSQTVERALRIDYSKLDKDFVCEHLDDFYRPLSSAFLEACEEELGVVND